MAYKFLSGCETGDLSEWSSTVGTVSVQTSTVLTGGFSGKVTSAGAISSLRSVTGLALTTGYARCRMRVYVTTNPTTTQNDKAAFYFLDSANNPIGGVRLGVTTTGEVSAHLFSGPNQIETASVTILADTTYLVEIKAVVSATVGSVEWKLDGVAQEALTNQNTGTADINVLRCQATFSSGSIDIYYDDVVVDDAAYPGAGKILCRQGVAGTPTYDAWTKTGLSTAALCWSESPFSGTNNCNLAGTAAGAQTMLVAPFSSTQTGKGSETIASGDTINACQQGIIAKVNSTTSPPVFSIRRRINGADTDLAQVLTTADVYYRGDMFTTTTTLLDSAEIGAHRGTSAATKTDTVADVWLMVDYLYVAPGGLPVGSLRLLGVGR